MRGRFVRRENVVWGDGSHQSGRTARRESDSDLTVCERRMLSLCCCSRLERAGCVFAFAREETSCCSRLVSFLMCVCDLEDRDVLPPETDETASVSGG